VILQPVSPIAGIRNPDPGRLRCPLLHPACQRVGRARRNDGGPQKGGDPTFINALVNGELAPKTVINPERQPPDSVAVARSLP
jgi:hypothetical protein